jgi:hypothetical protein
MYLKSFTLIAVALMLWQRFLLQAVFAEGVDCKVAEQSIKEASRIRGLEAKTRVPCTIETRDQVKAFLEKAIHTKVPAEKMRFDELVAKALGFIPEDYDYKKGLLDLYLSQLGGYYDPEKKRYVMAGWLPELMQPTVAVHELTHALQDQHFNLNTFIDDKTFYTDKLLARAALIEGDATAVMLDYQRALMDQPSIAKLEKVDSFILQTVLGMALVTTKTMVPESLKSVLLFPYASGTRFVHFLLRQGGYAEITAAFRSPPNTTSEILHPEKYSAKNSAPSLLSDANFETNGQRIEYRDSLGEFSITALLSSGEIKRELASKAAAGWAADLVVVYGTRDKEVVVWKILWDSALEAKEFFDAYRELLTARGFSIKQKDPIKVEIGVDSRVLTLTLNSTETVISSLPQPSK